MIHEATSSGEKLGVVHSLLQGLTTQLKNWLQKE